MRSLALVAALALGLGACQPKEPFAVSNAVFRPPLGSTDVGAAYFTITSSKPDRIIAVTSPKADSVEMHGTIIEGDRSSMQRLETLDLPAGRSVEFAPGSLHLMVFSPRLEADETAIPIIIELQSGAKRTIPFESHRGGEGHHG